MLLPHFYGVKGREFDCFSHLKGRSKNIQVVYLFFVIVATVVLPLMVCCYHFIMKNMKQKEEG